MTEETLMLGIKKLRSAGFPGEQNFDDETNAVWLEMLSDLGDEEFLVAVSKIIKTATFFPTIAKIREIALKRSIMLSSEAWTEVLGEMEKVCGTSDRPSFSSPMIERAVLSVGGLDTIWKAGVDQETYYRLNFINAYEAMAQSQQRDEVLGLPSKEEATKILEDFGLKMKGVGWSTKEKYNEKIS